jgi:hypothetical protein
LINCSALTTSSHSDKLIHQKKLCKNLAQLTNIIASPATKHNALPSLFVLDSLEARQQPPLRLAQAKQSLDETPRDSIRG